MPEITPAKGTVKVEFDFAVDSRAVVTISGNEYSSRGLEQELKLPPGEHSISVIQPGLTLEPRLFAVEQNQRRIVHVQEPNLRATEWALGLGWNIRILRDGRETRVTNRTDLPAGSFSNVRRQPRRKDGQRR